MSLEPLQSVCVLLLACYIYLDLAEVVVTSKYIMFFDGHCEINSTYMQAYYMHMHAILPFLPICLFRHRGDCTSDQNTLNTSLLVTPGSVQPPWI